MTPASVVSVNTADVKIQQDSWMFVGSQSTATQLRLLMQAVLHSVRSAKLWGVPPSPWTSFVWVQHSGSRSVRRNIHRTNRIRKEWFFW